MLQTHSIPVVVATQIFFYWKLQTQIFLTYTVVQKQYKMDKLHFGSLTAEAATGVNSDFFATDVQRVLQLWASRLIRFIVTQISVVTVINTVRRCPPDSCNHSVR
jgi:hypothetical protein